MAEPVESATLSLASLERGDRALVLEVDTADATLHARLAARGLVPGAEIGVVHAGDPVLVAIDDARWALTADDADVVRVDILERRRVSPLRRLLGR